MKTKHLFIALLLALLAFIPAAQAQDKNLEISINGFYYGQPGFIKNLDRGTVTVDNNVITLHNAILRNGSIAVDFIGDTTGLVGGVPLILRLEGENILEVWEAETAIECNKHINLHIVGNGSLSALSQGPIVLRAHSLTVKDSCQIKFKGGIETDFGITFDNVDVHVLQGGIGTSPNAGISLRNCAIVQPAGSPRFELHPATEEYGSPTILAISHPDGSKAEEVRIKPAPTQARSGHVK